MMGGGAVPRRKGKVGCSLQIMSSSRRVRLNMSPNLKFHRPHRPPHPRRLPRLQWWQALQVFPFPLLPLPHPSKKTMEVKRSLSTSAYLLAPERGGQFTDGCLHSYEAAEENEVSFVEGELITNIEAPSDDWWSGRNPRGEVGLFPGKRSYAARLVMKDDRPVSCQLTMSSCKSNMGDRWPWKEVGRSA
jgi:hypothetical protein